MHNKKVATNPMEVKLPNGDFIRSTHTATLDIPALPASAKEAHIFPHHFQHSLMSVGHLCDNGCDVHFSAAVVTVKRKGDVIFEGWRDEESGLWRVDLMQPAKTTPAQKPSANNVYEQRSVEDTIAYLHAACFSPVKDTRIKAIEAGNFATWPGLTAERVRKHLHKSEATVKGHLDQQRQNTRSTQPKPTREVDEPELIQEAKTNYVYAGLVLSEQLGQIHSDLTGRFPTTSYSGTKYVLVLYDYGSNTITTEPMKGQGDIEMVRTFKVLIHALTDRGLKPRLQRLDNECSKALRTFLHQEDIEFQLAHPHMHRGNSAERAIQTFKNHFIAGLCSVDPNFPLRLWDKLLPQATYTLNLLRQSCLNPRVSAYAQLNGHYDFNRAPMAPPGTRIIAHKKPDQWASWAPHGVDGWYLGPALDHYRCYRVHITETRGETCGHN